MTLFCEGVVRNFLREVLILTFRFFHQIFNWEAGGLYSKNSTSATHFFAHPQKKATGPSFKTRRDPLQQQQKTMGSHLAEYKSVLRRLLSWIDNREYPRDHVFDAQRLGELRPLQIRRWMQLQAYGTPDPAPDANPTLRRHTSIKFWKKAISYFMPNKGPEWNDLHNYGNPTKSETIRDLIKIVKRRKFTNKGLLLMHGGQ